MEADIIQHHDVFYCSPVKPAVGYAPIVSAGLHVISRAGLVFSVSTPLKSVRFLLLVSQISTIYLMHPILHFWLRNWEVTNQNEAVNSRTACLNFKYALYKIDMDTIF
jgi:hypothetical protein